MFPVLQDAVGSFKQAINLLMTSEKTLPPTFEAAETYYLMGLCYMEQMNLLQVGISYLYLTPLTPVPTDKSDNQMNNFSIFNSLNCLNSF